MHDGKEWQYEWNAAGMLAKVVRPDGNVVEFGYDALGRRVWKKYGSKTTKWVWDGNVPVHEWVEVEPGALAKTKASAESQIAATEAAIRQRQALLSTQPAQGPPPSDITWIFEPESFAPIAKLTEREQFGIVTDHLGTPTAMLDRAGREVWSADIGVYGDLRNVVGDKQACPFRWPGQYEDEETGLYYNRFRYYDPEAGEYVSQDPIGLGGGLGAASYIHDPLTWCDILGLAGCKAADKAANWQTSSVDYPNADRWRSIVLKKGTIVYGGFPGPSPFYTTTRGMSRGKSSRAAMFGGLQSMPDKKLGFRPSMRIYEVTQDTPATIAVAKANPQHGPGGFPQLFIEDYQTVLKPINIVPLPP